jgi:hypothetical protein
MNVTSRTVSNFIIEVLIYLALVSAYLALVFHFLVSWLEELSARAPTVYAFVAILLMIIQAVGLERLVSSLVHVTRQRRR